MASAAEERMRGRKERAPRTARYLWRPAVKTPSSRLRGVCTIQEKTITWRLSHRALEVTGSETWLIQLVMPLNTGAVRPSQLVKLRPRAMSRGTIAKPRKKIRAGTTSQVLGAERWAMAPPFRVLIYFLMVLFMLSENCAGVTEALKRRSSWVQNSAEAAGESARSQDCWKFGACLIISFRPLAKSPCSCGPIPMSGGILPASMTDFVYASFQTVFVR